MTLLEIRNLCETKMIELEADSFWYWDVGAFVFAGDETIKFASSTMGHCRKEKLQINITVT